MIRTDTIRSATTRHEPARNRLVIRFLSVLALAVGFIAYAGSPSYKPAVDDAGFDYYGHTEGGQQVGFVTLSVENGTLTVHLSDSATSDALPHRFDAIAPISSDRYAALYGAPDPGQRAVQAKARSREHSRLRKAAGMASLDQGWRIVHPATGIDDAVAAYSAWLNASGLSMTPDADNTVTNVRPFEVDGLDTPLRIVFHAQSDGVRVYVGSR